MALHSVNILVPEVLVLMLGLAINHPNTRTTKINVSKVYSKGEKEFSFSINYPKLNQQGQMFLLFETVPNHSTTLYSIQMLKQRQTV